MTRRRRDRSPGRLLEEDLIAERIAIDSYRDILHYVGAHDESSRRLIESILAVELTHAQELAAMRAELLRRERLSGATSTRLPRLDLRAPNRAPGGQGLASSPPGYIAPHIRGVIALGSLLALVGCECQLTSLERRRWLRLVGNVLHIGVREEFAHAHRDSGATPRSLPRPGTGCPHRLRLLGAIRLILNFLSHEILRYGWAERA